MAKKGTRILIIDDEKPIRKMLKVAFDAHGYEIAEAISGNDGLSQVAIFNPDLIILDLGLPDLDGIEVIQTLRKWSQVPVLIVSAREQAEEKIKAFDNGADDYITKPFDMGELLARIRMALRHGAKAEDEPVLTFGNLSIDLAQRLVTVTGREIRLTPIEYDLLKNLALHAGRVLTYPKLLRQVWGAEHQEDIHYLRVYIGQLRNKIEPDPTRPRYIITEPGIGYRLTTET